MDNKDSDASHIQFFSSNNGWKVMNHHLYTTSNAGQTWKMIALNYRVVDFDMMVTTKEESI